MSTISKPVTNDISNAELQELTLKSQLLPQLISSPQLLTRRPHLSAMALRRFNAGGKKQKELTDEQKQEMIFFGSNQ